jgi:DNA-binding MarR family transcriptional regulator
MMDMKTNHVVALISKVRDRAHSFIIRELEKNHIRGLVPSHGAILSHLFKKDGVSMKELAEEICRDKSTVTVLINKLVSSGYVRKQQSEDDQRIFNVYLTAKGELLKPEFDIVSQKLIERTFSDINQKEAEIIVKGLEKMLRNFNE